MKLLFNKDKENQINVFLEVDGKQRDFSYIEMLKKLIKKGKLQETEISTGFSDAEIKSINSMVKHINSIVTDEKKK